MSQGDEKLLLSLQHKNTALGFFWGVLLAVCAAPSNAVAPSPNRGHTTANTAGAFERPDTANKAPARRPTRSRASGSLLRTRRSALLGSQRSAGLLTRSTCSACDGWRGSLTELGEGRDRREQPSKMASKCVPSLSPALLCAPASRAPYMRGGCCLNRRTPRCARAHCRRSSERVPMPRCARAPSTPPQHTGRSASTTRAAAARLATAAASRTTRPRRR